jgi:hypothetical protein
MMRVIDPRIEKPTREMLGHAIRGDTQDLAMQIQAAGGEAYRQVIGLCLVAAAYIAVDVSTRWPTEADVREIARLTAERETEAELDQEDVYHYLSGAALAFEPLAEALGSDLAAATLPVLITGSMLFTFRPHGKEWWEYLDQIWDATMTAENLDEPVLPAVQVRTHRTRILKERDPASRLPILERADEPAPFGTEEVGGGN